MEGREESTVQVATREFPHNLEALNRFHQYTVVMPYSSNLSDQGPSRGEPRLSFYSAFALSAAYELYKNGKTKKFILCGEDTFGKKEVSTTDLMRRALENWKVPAEDIIEVSHPKFLGVESLDNTAFQIQAVAEEMKLRDVAEPVLIVDWRFHDERIKTHMEAFGLKAETVCAEDLRKFYTPDFDLAKLESILPGEFEEREEKIRNIAKKDKRGIIPRAVTAVKILKSGMGGSVTDISRRLWGKPGVQLLSTSAKSRKSEIEKAEREERSPRELVVGHLKSELDGLERERVFGQPQKAAQKAQEVKEEIARNLQRIRDLPEEGKEAEEAARLAFVDASFKRISALNSMAKDTAAAEKRAGILGMARAEVLRDEDFRRHYLLARSLGRDLEQEEKNWSEVKLRELGRLYSSYEDFENWRLSRLCFKKAIELAQRDSDLEVEATATMELARVSEKIARFLRKEASAAWFEKDPEKRMKILDGIEKLRHLSDWQEIRKLVGGSETLNELFERAQELNRQAGGDPNRQLTVSGEIFKRSLKHGRIGTALGSLATAAQAVIRSPRQLFVLGKKLFGR